LIGAGACSLLAATAWNAISLILFLTISQLGAAAMAPATFAMLFRAFPVAERVKATSLAQGTMAGSAMAGVVIGGPLIDLVGWRAIFIIQSAMCLLVLLPAIVVLRQDESVVDKKPVDYAGALALAATTFALTFGINRIGVWGVTPVSIGSLVAVPIGLWLLAGIERRAVSPIIPLRLLTSKYTWYLVGASFWIGVSWMGTLLLSPLYLQSVLGLSVGITALIIAPRAGTGVLAAPWTGRLGVRYGEQKLVIGCSLVVALSMGMLAVGAATRSIALVAIAIALSGTCMASVLAGLIAAAGRAVDEADFGIAVSLQQTSNRIGNVIGLGLFAAIAADAVTPGRFVLVFILAGAMGAISAACAVGLPRKEGAKPVTLVDVGADPLPAVAPTR
jgi:MFS family permease